MDDFDREVYCIAGLPFDAVNLNQAIERLWQAKNNQQNCFLTTPNLNFLALAQQDESFRQSVIQSDLVVADGMPIVWLARLLDIPIKERVAGSTLFESLSKDSARKMRVYFFGGPDGAAQQAGEQVNRHSTGLVSVGYYSPGFGTLEAMSEQSVIDHINQAKADFLVVALGAKKGQAWIVKNLHKLQCAIVSHLGAVVNFEAKRLKRAPLWLQKVGLEWAWRIKEEPQLWRRYWHDGLFLLKLLVANALPQAMWLLLNKKKFTQLAQNSRVTLIDTDEACKVKVAGVVLEHILNDFCKVLRQASALNKNVNIDLSEAEYLNPHAWGLLLMLKKHQNQIGLGMRIVGLNAKSVKLLKMNQLTYLI